MGVGGGGRTMRRITSRFVLMIATAAVAPLLVYGVLSVGQLRAGTTESVREGNLRVAQQVAGQIYQYIDHNIRVLRSVGLELGTTGLQDWQRDRILKDFVLDFPEFREITLFNAGGAAIATSRLIRPRASVPEPSLAVSGIYVAPVNMDTDLLPSATISVRIASADNETGWIVGEISLEELWRTVDRIRVGHEGYALVLAEDNALIAHGKADGKRLVATARDVPAKALASALRGSDGRENFHEYRDETGRQVIATAALVEDRNWAVIVEQPTAEAYAVTHKIERQLTLAIAFALLGTVVLGWVWGRSFIRRIFALTRATRALAEGRMEERVADDGADEIRQLGDAFNSMADKLVELQEDVRKQERQAMFGRIAAGLVHDLSHPVQNIVNNAKLVHRMFQDPEYRETFKNTVEREASIIKRVLEDLRNLARPIPLERFPVEINRIVTEAVETMQQHAETAGLTLRSELTAEAPFIEGDLFALGRVYRNLILNAIQATAPGGLIVVATEATPERVQIRIYDTGCGIAPDRLAAIFEDFVTTKRRGLGLGLAISKKIVEQLGGQISVASEVGKGTTFVLDFPRSRPRPLALVAG
jgi:signal transduction histidine kinase